MLLYKECKPISFGDFLGIPFTEIDRKTFVNNNVSGLRGKKQELPKIVMQKMKNILVCHQNKLIDFDKMFPNYSTDIIIRHITSSLI